MKNNCLKHRNIQITFFIISFLLVHQSLLAQADFEVQEMDASYLYFGQTPPGITPEIFAPTIVSTDEFEFCGTFTSDAKEYFFTRRSSYQANDNRIYYSKLEDGKWTRPALAPFGEITFEFEPVASPNEDKIYFYSERSEKRNSLYDGDIWVTEKASDGWSEPEYFQSPVNKKWCMSVCPSLDGTLYFSSNYEGKRGIYKSEMVNQRYPDVEYLSENINSEFYAHPYIAPDESLMIFDGQPSGRGKSELFITYKAKDGTWSKPKNMGSLINKTKTEFGASISPDGKYLFFHRRENAKGDIYWVDTKILKNL